MTQINIATANAYELPAGARLCKIKGDYLTNGFRNDVFVESDRYLEIVVFDCGKALIVQDGGYLIDAGGKSYPVTLDVSGEIPVAARVTFAPNAGQLKRHGIQAAS